MKKLDERRKKILWAIIQSHIDLNTPIGSKYITKHFAIGLSPATIRNTMAKLEELGFITQPHTSAGRIPTEKGYRFYVDALMEEHTLSINSDLTNKLSRQLIGTGSSNDMLIKEAAKTLSMFSHYLAIATPPKLDDAVLKRIKFIKHENRKILVVLMSDDGIVNNRIIELDKVYSQRKLDMASQYLNSRFCGLSIKKVREKIAYQLYKEKTLYDELIENLLYLCKEIIPAEHEGFSLNSLSGASNLPDFATMKQIKEILRAIEDKHFMLKLLKQVSGSEGTRVIVGMENILPAMKELSLVISTYSDKQLASGAIGIIGPTRMNYRMLIPMVDETAKALTQILSKL